MEISSLCRPSKLFNKGYYLRSSGIWNIDNGNLVSVISIGSGTGKRVEPQRALHHTGAATFRLRTHIERLYQSPSFT